jgi:ABC-type branched-subunit amino acid transport system ATPase component
VLAVRALTAGYNSPVVKEATVTVRNNEIVCVLGPNGAGKSTLLKAITGVIKPWSGSVTLFGDKATGLRTDLVARRGLGYVPQVRDVFAPLTVQENLEMGGYRLGRATMADRIEEVFIAFPALAAMRKRRAGNLSGGERKMLAIGRVLMNHPKLLVLDEPTANLAPRVAQQLLEEHVQGLAIRGASVLFVEQRALEALKVSSWAYIMIGGTVSVSAEACELRTREGIGEFFLGRTTGRAEAT